MNAGQRRWIGAAAMIGGALLFADRLEAQLTPAQLHAEANHLHDLAVERHDGRNMFLLVRDHGAAAQLRTVDDPRAVECTRFQASLLYMTGDLDAARAELERAAGIAIARAEFGSAAVSYLEAAFVAKEQGRNGDVIQLASTAYHLSQNPNVGRTERSAVVDRLPEGFRPR